MPKAQTKELIVRMKAIKQLRGITNAELEQMTIDNGAAVSLTSIRRVFAEGSENKDFRTETTLIPLANILLDTETIQTVLAPGPDANAERLRGVMDLKDDMIQVLSRQVESLQQNEAELKQTIGKKNKAILALVSALGVAILSLVCLLLIL